MIAKIKKKIVKMLSVCCLSVMAVGGAMVTLPNGFVSAESKASIFSGNGDVLNILENQTVEGVGNGVLVEIKSSEAVLTYENIINANALNADFPLLSLMAVSGEDFAVIQEMEILLTDTENETNYIGWKWSPTQTKAEASDCLYVLGSYCGEYLGLSNEFANTVWSNQFGAVGWGVNFVPHKFGSSVMYMSLGYQEKRLYFGTDKPTLLLDMINPKHVGSVNLWEGFEVDTAKLTIRAEIDDSGKKGAFLITEVMGQSMSGALSDMELSKPNIVFEAEEELLSNMPWAAKNEAYNLPSAFAYDWFYGLSELKMNIFLNEQDVTEQTLNGQVFTAKEAGEYTVVYSAENLKGESKAELKVSVLEKLPQYHVFFAEDIVYPALFEYFYLPKIAVSGGTGQLTVQETLSYNGKEIKIEDSRLFYIGKTGALVYNVIVSGYSGKPFVKSYFFKVENKGADFVVPCMPRAVKSGERFVFPKVVVEEEAGTYFTEIYVDGVLQTQEYFVCNKAHGEKLALTYKVTQNGITTEKNFEIDVINPETNGDYFLMSAGEATIDGGAVLQGTKADGDVQAEVAYPVSGDYLTLIFSVVKSGFKYLDISFNDYYYPALTTFIRITPYSASHSYLQINGKGEKYLISGSFNGSERFSLIVDSRNGGILDGAAKKIADAFISSSHLVYVSFTLGEIESEGGISIRQISNQLMTGTTIKPVVYTMEYMPERQEVLGGTCISVYDAIATNPFGMSDCTLEILAPDGSEIYKGECKDMQFFAEECGYYQIRYITDIDKKQEYERFIVQVLDREKPTITVNGEIEKSYELNDSLKIPTFTATDNVDTEAIISYITIFYERDFSRKTVKPNTSFKFTKPGNYVISYVAYDSVGNVSTVSYKIEVK